MDAPIHILVVDDEADLLELVSYNLKKEGFIVGTAADGEKALAQIKKGSYALLILDLMLPGIQGMKFSCPDFFAVVGYTVNTILIVFILLTAPGGDDSGIERKG